LGIDGVSVRTFHRIERSENLRLWLVVYMYYDPEELIMNSSTFLGQRDLTYQFGKSGYRQFAPFIFCNGK
jgi:hypothetical protein